MLTKRIAPFRVADRTTWPLESALPGGLVK